MTSTQMHSYFDLLVDKQGAPYFSEDNKDLFINMAQIEYIKQLLPSNEGGVVNVEFNHVVTSNIVTLLYEVGTTSMSAQGEVTKTAIQALLDTASSSTEPFMFVFNVSSDGKPVKYTKHNDWFEFADDTFKAGSAEEPRFKELATKFVFSPINASSLLKFTVLKQPKDIALGVTDSEYPPHTHKNIVELAVDLATVTLRDGDLKQLNGIN
jgi:hypothetical protein